MNVILIVSGTFRHDHLECYGNDWIMTLHLDRFAGESLCSTGLACVLGQTGYVTMMIINTVNTCRHGYSF